MIHYINIEKKRLVGRNNQPNNLPLAIDFHTLGTIDFAFINDCNQIKPIDENLKFYLAGSKKMNREESKLLFLSKTYTIKDNVITFTVDTYTQPFIEEITKKNTEINVEISAETDDSQQVLLRDTAYANPRVYVPGFTPPPVDPTEYYTKDEVDNLLNDYQPISGMNLYALKSDISSGGEKLDENAYYLDVNNMATYNTPGLLTTTYYSSNKSEEVISSQINKAKEIAWEYTFDHKKILSKSSKWYFSDFKSFNFYNSIGNRSDIEMNIYYQKNNDNIVKFAAIKSDISSNRIYWPPSRIFKNLLTEDIVLNPSDKIILKIESFSSNTVIDVKINYYYAKFDKAFINVGIFENIIPPDFILMSQKIPSNKEKTDTQAGVLQNKFDDMEQAIRNKPSYLWNYSPSYNYLYFATSITQNYICKVFVLAQNITLSRDKISISDWNKKYTLLFYNPNGYTLKVTDSKNQSHTLVTSEKTDYTYVELFNFGTSTYNNGYIAMLFNNEIIILGNR